MIEWRETTLGEALEIHHGFAFKGEYFRDEGALILLTPGNFNDSGGFKPKNSQEKYYDGPVPSEYLLSKGDVVVAMTEQAHGLLGSTATIPASDRYLHNQRLGLLRVTDPKKLDLRFCYHLMNVPSVRQQIQATATGAKVRHTAPGRIRAVRVRLPDVATQQVVAGILDDLDDLIENNQQRIELLEQMARAIYREWFVRFQYPGHGDVPLVDSDLGPLPEGWELRPLFDVAEPTFGFPFKSKLFNLDGDGMPLIRIRDLPRNGTETWTTETASPQYEVEDGDLLIGMDGDFHMCRWSGGSAYLNQRVVRFRPLTNVISRYEIFLALERPIRRLNESIVGTTVAHLGKRHLEALRLVVPSADVRGSAQEIFDPLFDLSIQLRKVTANLRATRDLLLPRLISGEIDVSKLDLEGLVDSV